MPILSMASWTALRSSAVRRRYGPAAAYRPMVTTSTTDTGRASGTFVDCITYAIRFGGTATSMLPEIGVTRPAMALSRVDLPEPLGPITAVRDPNGISNEERLIAVRLP